DYRHNERWGDGNGHSHVRASLLGPSLTVPFSAGRLLLGTWQQVVFVDFDVRPRSREIVVQMIGE
ncbi:MAG TPA: YjbQ family protein, partial [bacterium]|nr:YjbQ family protein [bacterium]